MKSLIAVLFMGVVGFVNVGSLYACDGSGRDRCCSGTNRYGDYSARPYGYQRRALPSHYDAYGDNAEFRAQRRDDRDSEFVPAPSQRMRLREQLPEFSGYDQQIPQNARPTFTDRSNRVRDIEAPAPREPIFNRDRTIQPIAPEQSVRYGGQKTCPVTGEELGSMGPALPVTIQGRTVFVCCKACVSAIKRNPAKFLQAVDAELA